MTDIRINLNLVALAERIGTRVNLMVVNGYCHTVDHDTEEQAKGFSESLAR